MRVRLFQPADLSRWMEMRALLWPDEDLAGDDPSMWTVFIAEEGENAVAFLELGMRDYAEGCVSSPVPYVEGWFVEEAWRRRGVGRALMQAAEEWSRERGFTEFASDTNDWNQLSRDAHRALGFEEVETIVVFRKVL